jgi:hypothetical protein
MEYAMQEASFTRPAALLDGTVNRLVYRRPTGTMQVLVTRTLAQRKSLAELTALRLRDQRRALPYFTLADQSERLVTGKPAVDVRVSYHEGDTKVYQRSASFLVDARLVLLAVQGPEKVRDDIDATFEHALRTLAFRRPAA